MKKAVDFTLHEFSSIHTGKASPSMVEGVMVEAYGSMMRLKECAATARPTRASSKSSVGQGLIRAVEKAIQQANLGINPIVDGGLIRLPLPDLSKERRLEFVKIAHKLAEEGRVQPAPRPPRRHGVRQEGQEGRQDLRGRGEAARWLSDVLDGLVGAAWISFPRASPRPRRSCRSSWHFLTDLHGVAADVRRLNPALLGEACGRS